MTIILFDKKYFFIEFSLKDLISSSSSIDSRTFFSASSSDKPSFKNSSFNSSALSNNWFFNSINSFFYISNFFSLRFKALFIIIKTSF